jgi:hypothetical protein
MQNCRAAMGSPSWVSEQICSFTYYWIGVGADLQQSTDEAFGNYGNRIDGKRRAMDGWVGLMRMSVWLGFVEYSCLNLPRQHFNEIMKSTNWFQYVDRD